MTTTVDRSALIDAIRAAAEAATDDWTHVAVCANDVHLRAARRWRATCDGCDEPIADGNVGLSTWCDGPPNYACHHGGYNHQHGCGAWNSPTEVEIDLDEELPAEVEVDPDGLPWWAEEHAAELVERVVRMLDRQCADEQQDEAERVEQRLRNQIRVARAALTANAEVDGDPIAAYLAAKRRRDEALDEDARTAAQDEMDEAASLLALCDVAVDPDGMEEGGIYVDPNTGKLAAWDWDPRSISPETGAYSDFIEVGEDERGQA